MLIAQLSDPHLRPHGVLYQELVDSDAMFRAAIRHVNALDPRPDLVILSGARLARVIARYPAFERVLCGHVHRFMQVRFGDTLLCTAPSTTTAIALRLHPDAEPSAYLLHHWKPDTGIVVHFVPIGVFPGPFPFA